MVSRTQTVCSRGFTAQTKRRSIGVWLRTSVGASTAWWFMSRQGHLIIAHLFIGGRAERVGAAAPRGAKDAYGVGSHARYLSSLMGLFHRQTTQPTDKSVGYCRTSLAGHCRQTSSSRRRTATSQRDSALHNFPARLPSDQLLNRLAVVDDRCRATVEVLDRDGG